MDATENCSVKVAVHIRPLVGDECVRGCRECVTVTPGKPQVQIGTHSFTFDHVYGNGGSSPNVIFEQCVAPLIDGLFQGYNATVLAYGQTGSGKTYTMGTGLKEGSQPGVIPQVMNALFKKIGKLKHQAEFQLHVSFIEILKEEVKDLLDSVSEGKTVTNNGHAGKLATPGKPPIQIRESSNGVITLTGSTEIAVSTLQEMASCLEQGSISRATGSTNMNNQSSRSHAIFTITLEQMRKLHSVSPVDDTPDEDMVEEYVCAKLHLVDLAGSERAKRTGSYGLRLKEGIHINKGLLALGNVISALGDEKKRKEGVHVPYRDSKLTRLLQDSLGGNSKTVMIACISPADINGEETLNTLKYANRARNIQNKPVVNRDLISNEIQMMRQQLKYLQAELCARAGGSPSEELQILKDRIAWLEATNEGLTQELHEYRSRCGTVQPLETEEGYSSSAKSDGHKRDFQSMDSSDYQMDEPTSGESSGEIYDAEEEWEHALMQNAMDKQLNELNKRLVQKECEMKLFGRVESEALEKHFRKKIVELEEEKRIVQQERDHLLAEIESLGANSDGHTQKPRDTHEHKLKALETQILDLKKKQESQFELLKQKQRSEEAAKKLQVEIQYIKSQKVQLQNKMKQEAEQFRQWKASQEKELLQLRKEGRRNEYERHKLEVLHQRQKMALEGFRNYWNRLNRFISMHSSKSESEENDVLQRKTEEAAIVTKRLKELLEARKTPAQENLVNHSGPVLTGQGNEKSFQRWLDHELEIRVNVHRVRCQHEKHKQEQAALMEELNLLRQEDQSSQDVYCTMIGKNGESRLSLMSPPRRKARIASLESMLTTCSNAILTMASQLSEAEERDRSFISRGQWSQLRSMGEAKNLVQHMFTATAEAKCQLLEKEMEIKDLKDQLNELVSLLQQSEVQRKGLVKEQKMREQAVAIALATSYSGNLRASSKHYVDDMSGPLSPISLPAPKQLKFTPGIVNGSVRESVAFLDETRKRIPVGQLSSTKLLAVGQTGKLWRWKRSHHQWLLQFKWKWQKPWKLSEWIKHSDETIIRSRPRLQAVGDLV